MNGGDLVDWGALWLYTVEDVLMFQSNKSVLQALRILQGGQWVDIIDHWSIIDHKMVDVLEFVDNITLKWLIFHQNIQKRRYLLCLLYNYIYLLLSQSKEQTNSMFSRIL